jgi:riboflavin synthase
MMYGRFLLLNMFTGIIESVGKILEISDTGEGKRFKIHTPFENWDVEKGHSIAINGTCLTVEVFDQNSSECIFYVSYKTLELTNLGKLKKGGIVNLERSVTPMSRLGGHMVQGHVDGIGVILSKEMRDSGKTFRFELKVPNDMLRFIIPRGSITIDGISLTVVGIQENQIELVLIPETMNKTNAYSWEEGVEVNIETDLIAKYIDRMALFQ